MILQKLEHYYQRMHSEAQFSADIRNPVAPWGYMSQGISWAVVITKDGAFSELRDLREEKAGKARPRRMMVPWLLKAACRSSDKTAFPLWDKTDYALGGKLVKDKLNNLKFEATPKHKSVFKAQVEKIAAKIPDDAGLQALLNFLKRDHEVTQWSLADQLGDGSLVFQLKGAAGYIHESAAVCEYWHQHWLEESREEEIITGQCLLTGQRAIIARLHQPIKGVKDAQSSGARLVSFNKDSFASYRLKQGDNAPTGERAAFAYTTALNYLLRTENKRSLIIADTTVVFWAEKATLLEDSFHIFFTPPAEEQATETIRQDNLAAKKVLSRLRVLRNGQIPTEKEDDKEMDLPFYLLGLAPNAARLAIRFWYVTSFGALLTNMSRHLCDINIERQYASQPEFPSASQLLSSLTPARKIKKGKMEYAGISKIPSSAIRAFMQALFMGHNYPAAIYATIVNRIHHDGYIDYFRIALLKGVLNRNYKLEVPIVLDKDRKEPAYRLGRLFAVLEKAQYDAADGKINATIKDNFFSSASATPASVFPKLLRMSQYYLKKLKYKIFYERKIEEILADIGNFPKRFSSVQQGLFIIGYYHQRNDLFSKQDSAKKQIEDN
jgi:CRISPR-associated protein Csd1